MKYLIVLFSCILCVYGVSEELQEKTKTQLMEIAAICIPATSANEDDIAELLEKKLPSRREGKCLVSCFQKKLGLQNEDDGKPSREGALKFLEPVHDDDPELYTKLIQLSLTCGPRVYDMPLTDHCDIGVEIIKCTQEVGEQQSDLSYAAFAFLVILLIDLTYELNSGDSKRFKEKLKTSSEECLIETKISQEDIAMIVAKKVPSSHRGRCYLLCLHKKLGFQIEDGDEDQEPEETFMATLASLDPKFWDRISSCEAKLSNDGDSCDNAALLFECYTK